MLITRLRISWYMGGFMALWAVVSTLTALAKDFKGLLLTRFFLGITEAPYYPGALYMLSIFYTRKEIATRISILYTGNILATAFAGLIALGIFQMGGMAGLSGWRWLFIIQGLVTFVIALASLFVLPDDPTRTWWLTPEERKLAQERMDRDTVGNQGQSSTLQGLKEAVKDIVGHPLAPTTYHLLTGSTTAPLGLRIHPTHAYRGQRLQELFSDGCADTGLQQGDHARADMPAVPDCRHCLGHLVVAFGAEE